eukprot:TRINITY_DN1533_c0_g1_i6.p1 TRINITY_DN1533_c0_g1~~TRINITY_DN1533_c0_g1_i6.p1  ORF type:complete len:448 (+),score=125.63 TRINITY_DN1533_c0_g1_i6:80-1345(+)
MAPKIMKRPAASQASGVAKKPTPAVAEKPVDRFEAIKEAIHSSETFPVSVREMLVACMQDGLGVPKDQRREPQNAFVRWVSEVLDCVRKEKQDAVEATEARVADGDEEKARRAAKEKISQEILAKKNTVLESARSACVESTRALQETKANLSAAEAAQIHGDSELDKAAKKKAELEGAKSKLTSVLSVGPASSVDVAALIAVSNELGLEPSMLTALPGALGKPVESRGEFDGVVFDFFEKELENNVAKLADVLANGESAKQDRATKVAEAASANEAAVTAFTVATDGVQMALKEKTEAETGLREAQLSLEQVVPEMNETAAALDALKLKLQAFENGVLAQFHELESAVSPELVAERKAATLAAAAEAEAADAEAAEAETAEAALVEQEEEAATLAADDASTSVARLGATSTATDDLTESAA